MAEPQDTKHICASCTDCMSKRDVAPGDFCSVHWAKIEVEVPKSGFYCEHHKR